MTIAYDQLALILVLIGGMSIFSTAVTQVIKKSEIQIKPNYLPLVSILIGIIAGLLSTFITSGVSLGLSIILGGIAGFMSIGNFEFVKQLQTIFSNNVKDNLQNK